MKQTAQYFQVKRLDIFKQKMLNWVNQFSIFCFLDNNDYAFDTPAFNCILAVDAVQSVQLQKGVAYQQLKEFYQSHSSDWLFGHLGFGLKNETENLLNTTTPDNIGFGDGFFFAPQILIQIKNNQVSISSQHQTPEEIFENINSFVVVETSISSPEVKIQHSLSKEEYLQRLKLLQTHIRKGDCYEINFCQHFFAENVQINPLFLFTKLQNTSPTPFAAFYKWNDKYCICASPERYLKKQGPTLISQPMKGTSKRFLDDPEKDNESANILLNSLKERSENIMVVDLVRNDFSKICAEGSVKVEELCGLYSFPKVHQLISTVTGELPADKNWVDAVQATFPMGSMTGAPKKRVLELIDLVEPVERGLFSGAIGYVSPDQNVDFNVVIRSVFYNESNKYLSFYAGGGITHKSIPEEEYEESILKTMAILEALKLS